MAADDSVRFVELTRERVVLRRAVHGMKMAINLPVATYIGVAVRVVPPDGESSGAISIVLEHRDSALSVPLYHAADASEVVAEWQCWGRVLGLPLLVAETDGRLREPFRRTGALFVGTPIGRRRRRSAVRRRRPSILLRRKVGRPAAVATVHREREIIARS